MSASKKHRISLNSQIIAIQKYKAEIKRLRNALTAILIEDENYFEIKEIAKEALNSKTKIHFHSTANELFYRASQKVIPCLEDWIKTTGFGEINKRDREALELLQKAVERSKEEYDAVS